MNGEITALQPPRRPVPSPGQHARPVLLLVLAAMLWATYTPVTSLAVGAGLPVTVLLLAQVAIATASLWLVGILRGSQPVIRLRRVVLLGAFEPAGNGILFALALTLLPAAHGSLLLASECVLVAVLGVLVLRERLSPSGWVALLMCVPGLWLLSGTESLIQLSPGALLVLAATSASALSATLAAWVVREEADPLAVTVWQFTAGLGWVSIVAVAHLIAASPAVLAAALATPVSAWWAAAAGGLLLAVPCVLYNHAIGQVPIAHAGMLLNLIPVFGAAIAVIWLDNVLTVHHLFGAAITIGSIATLTARR